MSIALDILRRHRDEIGAKLLDSKEGPLNIWRAQAAAKHNLCKRLIAEIEAAELKAEKESQP